MSNQQWNQGQSGAWTPQPPEGTPEQGQAAQQAPQDWGQQQNWAQQGQTSASEWGQPTGQPSAPQGTDWTQGQSSAQEWAQPQAQPQAQPSGQDWGQQQWQDQQQGQQQGWDQNQQWGQQPPQQWGQQGHLPAGYAGTGAPQWAPQPKKPGPFDFSFKRPALPDAAGAIFVLGTIGIGVWWLFQVIESLSYLFDYPMGFFTSVLGGAGLAIFGIMMLRTLLEVGVAMTRTPEPGPDDGEAQGGDSSA